MPYAQPQDADQQFYSDFNVQWTGGVGAAPVVSTVKAPPGVTVGWSAAGLYLINLPAVYLTNSPLVSVEIFATINASTAAATDAFYLARYVPAGSNLLTGVLMISTASAAAPTVPLDLTAAYTASVLVKLKFATVLVQNS